MESQAETEETEEEVAHLASSEPETRSILGL
jgi:hypothetical protein